MDGEAAVPGESRRAQLLERLSERGSVSVARLVDHFGVSEVTIRRDLGLLEQQGLCRRVRGGAIQPQGRSYEPPFALRRTFHEAEKDAIAEAALLYVNDGDSIALDVGSTTLALARRLTARHNLTVITPSLSVAGVLADHPSVRVLVSGGLLRPSESSLVGHLAEQAFTRFHVDRLFLGVGGIHADHGMTEFNVEDTLVKQAMLQTAKETIVLADSSKLDRIVFATVAPVSRVDRLVTDAGADPDAVARLEDKDLDVVTASAESKNHGRERAAE